jgi:hypothetical protein
MRKVDIPEFRNEVISLIQTNRKKLTSLEISNDHSDITFCGKHYICKVKLDDTWIGYDLEIKVPKGYMTCGRQNDTDIYPIYGENEGASLEIYDDLLKTLQTVFDGKLYYITTPDYEYTARKNNDGTYSVGYMERRKFIFWNYATGWRDDEYLAEDVKTLEMTVLS